MKKYNKITPEGTKDILFEECITRRSVEKKLADVFSAHGYHEVVTPGLEFFDVFHFDGAEFGQELMYKMTDKRGRLVVMRPDSTIPIARMTATRLQNQPKPIRLYYTQQVYCNTPGLGGKSDEVMQSGIELIGANGLRADLEVIVTAIEALSKCVPDFRIELGHAGFFKAIAEQLSVSADVIEDIRLSIEAKNYPLLDTILDKLEPSKAVDAMRNLPRLFGGGEIFEEAAAYCMDEKSKATLAYLKELFDDLCELNLGDKMMVDLGLVHRNDYYTDIVFSAYVEDCGDAVLSGGRYDNLLASFDMPMPAIGFAIDVDAVTQVLIEQGRGPKRSNVEILVHGDAGYEIKALRHMADMVEFGNYCENSVLATREEAIAYAKNKKIPRIDFVADRVETMNLD